MGILAEAFPVEIVREAIESCGRLEKRQRLLPAQTVVYFVLAMCLFPQLGYTDVMRLVTPSRIVMSEKRRPPPAPTTAAIGRARLRLGPEPLKELFHRLCRPAPGTCDGDVYRGRHIAVLDAINVDLPGSAANLRHFGPHPQAGGASVRSQARVTVLSEVRAHGVFEVETGPAAAALSETALRLLPKAPPGGLVLTDWRFIHHDCRHAVTEGTDLLWRDKGMLGLQPLEVMPDGSYLARLPLPSGGREPGREAHVRVIRYAEPPGWRDRPHSCTSPTARDPECRCAPSIRRLLTTIADPDDAPADELVELYVRHQQTRPAMAEILSPYGAPPVLRSQHPEGVVQEVFALLCVHYALCRLIHQVPGSEPGPLLATLPPQGPSPPPVGLDRPPGPE
ncbi:transposase domain-containing protein [Kitasatospora hibisci]|uniref:transposase domain-containing protein n=1 Tax=Kitasatospora hibisci TaxID=3369522 RepID=UPI0037548322